MFRYIEAFDVLVLLMGLPTANVNDTRRWLASAKHSPGWRGTFELESDDT